MTEEEWLALPVDSARKWQRAKRVASDRKTRLFAVACCRRVWHLLTNQHSREAVELSELSADAAIDLEIWRKAAQAALGVAYASPASDAKWDASESASYAAAYCTNEPTRNCLWAVTHASNAEIVERMNQIGDESNYNTEIARVVGAEQLALLHDIIGNPFRRIRFEPRWRTSDVLGLARAIYEDRAFDRMPILADALMDAGCADEQIIDHCRGDGPHVRGCWVVDLVLGKE